MHYILYNPKSNSGKTAKKIVKFSRKLKNKKLNINLLIY